jgi:hypothetical protein
VRGRGQGTCEVLGAVQKVAVQTSTHLLSARGVLHAAERRPPAHSSHTTPSMHAAMLPPVSHVTVSPSTQLGTVTGQRPHTCAGSTHPCQPPTPRPHAPPVKRLLTSCRSSSAASFDQVPGSGPLRVLPQAMHTRSLDKADQEDGRGPVGGGWQVRGQARDYSTCWQCTAEVVALSPMNPAPTTPPPHPRCPTCQSVAGQLQLLQRCHPRPGPRQGAPQGVGAQIDGLQLGQRAP